MDKRLLPRVRKVVECTYYLSDGTNVQSCLGCRRQESETPCKGTACAKKGIGDREKGIVEKETLSPIPSPLSPGSEGYYESKICPGLFFDEYHLDVEMNGQAGLTPKQYVILKLLDARNGSVDVEEVKTKCWHKETDKGNFATHIYELNKRLVNIGVENSVTVHEGMLLFQ